MVRWADIARVGSSMDHNDVYKLRAEEYERSFYSLRKVEWPLAFQSYTAYAAIALAYNKVRDGHIAHYWLGLACAGLTFIVFALSIYLALRVQERLHCNRMMQARYLNKLHRSLYATELNHGSDGPIHARWYAFGSYLLLSTILWIGMTVYIAINSYESNAPFVLTVITIVCTAIMLISLGWFKTHNGQLVGENSDSFKKSSTNIRGSEVTLVGRDGFWLVSQKREFFVPFSGYPVFRQAPVEQIYRMEEIAPGQLRWESLDSDIELDALENPERYPLKFSARTGSVEI